jgi:hypothetical protein
MKGIRGKSIKSVTFDIAEGYVTVNPLFLKPLDAETIKELYQEIQRTQNEIRGEQFPHGDVKAIRQRNLRLQRLHTAAMIIRNYMRTKKIFV